MQIELIINKIRNATHKIIHLEIAAGAVGGGGLYPIIRVSGFFFYFLLGRK